MIASRPRQDAHHGLQRKPPSSGGRRSLKPDNPFPTIAILARPPTNAKYQDKKYVVP